MMNRFFLFSVALGLALLSACKPTPKEAGRFNDLLMEQQRAVVVSYDRLLETFDTYVPKKMDGAFAALVEQLAASRAVVEGVVPVSGGEALKDEVLRYFAVMEDAADNDIEYLVRVYKLPENEFTAEVRQQWDSKYKDVDRRIKEAAACLRGVQSRFAEDYRLVIGR